MVQPRHIVRVFTVGLLLTAPSVSDAGPPLICHPFQTGAAEVLPWGDGSHWNTPNERYDVGQLTRDTLRLLSSNTPLLARMENIRRATIYAARDARVADELLQAIVARAQSSPSDAQAWFDAGYLIESYKQAAHLPLNALENARGGPRLERRPAPTMDGYAMVTRAIAMSDSNAEMEFAASLMTSGSRSAEHRRKAQAGASTGSLLARNLGR